MAYEIKKVDLPPATRTSTQVYDVIITDINTKGPGCYSVTVKGKKPDTVYQNLSRRLKGNKKIMLHKIKGEVYIEKIA